MSNTNGIHSKHINEKTIIKLPTVIYFSIGKEYYNKIREAINNKQVIIDMQKVETATIDGIYGIFGKLTQEFTLNELTQKIKIINISNTLLSMILLSFTLNNYSRKESKLCLEKLVQTD